MSLLDRTKTIQTHKHTQDDTHQSANTELDDKRTRALALSKAVEEFQKADDAIKSLNRELNRPFKDAEIEMTKIEKRITKTNEALKDSSSVALGQEKEGLKKAHEAQKKIYLKQFEDGINNTDLLSRCFELRAIVRKEQYNAANVEGCTKEMQNIQKGMNTLIDNVKKLEYL